MQNIYVLYTSFGRRIKESPLLNDITYTLFLGFVSLLFGYIKFYVPGIEGAASDFREIPLLIAILYLRNPIFILPLSLITILILPEGVSHTSTFFMHFIPLLVMFWLYKYLKSIKTNNILKAVLWMIFVIIYYQLNIILLVLGNYWVGLSSELDFIKGYVHVLTTFKFEIIATTMITGLYYSQQMVRRDLEEHKANLEITVTERTKEIATVNKRLLELNEELMSSSTKIKLMNENLDELVKERSKKIEDQLQSMVRYAHMNSHEVRAPLARILGLLHLIDKEENNSEHFETILTMLYTSSIELDEVVKQMNRLLEKEILS